VTRGTYELVVVNMDIEFSNGTLVEHSCGGADAVLGEEKTNKKDL